MNPQRLLAVLAISTTGLLLMPATYAASAEPAASSPQDKNAAKPIPADASSASGTAATPATGNPGDPPIAARPDQKIKTKSNIKND